MEAELWLTLESVAVTVLVPPVVLGTMQVALKEPVLSVIGVDGVVEICDPANDTVTVEFAANPLPVTVKEEPTNPVAGFRVRLGETVNEAFNELLLESVTLIVWAPVIDAGIWKEAPENWPELVAAVCVTKTPS